MLLNSILILIYKFGLLLIFIAVMRL